MKCDFCGAEGVVGISIISGPLNLDNAPNDEYRQQGFSCSGCLPKLRIVKASDKMIENESQWEQPINPLDRESIPPAHPAEEHFVVGEIRYNVIKTINGVELKRPELYNPMTKEIRPFTEDEFSEYVRAVPAEEAE